METTKVIGKVPCTGGTVSGKLSFPSTDPDRVEDTAQQSVSYDVVEKECGTLSGDVTVTNHPLSKAAKNLDKVFHPLRCVSCGEKPYPLYPRELND